MKSSHRSQRGFSLLEVMIVVVILGILVSIVALNIRNKDEMARMQAARAKMEEIVEGIEMYKLDCHSYPQKLEDLVVRPSGVVGWQDRYVKKNALKDPWGNPFVYHKPGEDGEPFDLISLGRDGKTGGESYDADIVASQE